MLSSGRRSRSSINIWPGYVDALSALLMLVIFMLMIYMVTQLYLSQTLSNRDTELASLNDHLSEITRLLGVEEERTLQLSAELDALQSEYERSLSREATLESVLESLVTELNNAETQLNSTQAEILELQASLETERLHRAALERLQQEALSALQESNDARTANQEQISALETRLMDARQEAEGLQLQLATQQNQIVELRATLEEEQSALAQVRAELILSQTELRNQTLALTNTQQQVQTLTQRLTSTDDDLRDERRLTTNQEASIRRLTHRIALLQQQLQQISNALRLQLSLNEEKDTEIAGLGTQINRLLAERVNELERYQSVFFGRLREALESHANIRIVGDRFLLPSELFFESGSAQIGAAGQVELNTLATLLLDVAKDIPSDIDWIVRIDGHTDRVPINTPLFPSNWELSTARAVSVVRYLIDQGIPPHRLAATGFGEFYPVDTGQSAQAFQRNRRIEIKLTDR